MESDMAINARTIARELNKHFPQDQALIRQVIGLAEEAGEFAGAYRRAAGMARRPGDWDDVYSELADVVITAYVTAEVMGIDLDAQISRKLEVIYTRGWREFPAPTTPVPAPSHGVTVREQYGCDENPCRWHGDTSRFVVRHVL